MLVNSLFQKSLLILNWTLTFRWYTDYRPLTTDRPYTACHLYIADRPFTAYRPSRFIVCTHLIVRSWFIVRIQFFVHNSLSPINCWSSKYLLSSFQVYRLYTPDLPFTVYRAYTGFRQPQPIARTLLIIHVDWWSPVLGLSFAHCWSSKHCWSSVNDLSSVHCWSSVQGLFTVDLSVLLNYVIIVCYQHKSLIALLLYHYDLSVTQT